MFVAAPRARRPREPRCPGAGVPHDAWCVARWGVHGSNASAPRSRGCASPRCSRGFLIGRRSGSSDGPAEGKQILTSADW